MGGQARRAPGLRCCRGCAGWGASARAWCRAICAAELTDTGGAHAGRPRARSSLASASGAVLCCMGLGSRPGPPIADRRVVGAGSWSRRVSGLPEQAHLRRSVFRREPRAALAALTGDRSSLEACEDWATAAGALDGGGCLPSAP